MLARFLYAELPKPSFSFVGREPGVYEWAAVRRPILSFVDQEKIQPKLEWAAVRRPDMLFASMPRMELEFVPFDIELFSLIETPTKRLIGQASVVVAPAGRMRARLTGEALIQSGCLGTLQTSLQGQAYIQTSPTAVFRTYLKGAGLMSLEGTGRLALNARGAASMTVQPSGRLAARFKGVANIAAAAQARLAVALKGAAQITMSPTAAPAQPLFLSGTALVTMNASASARAIMRGAAAMAVTPTAILRRRLQGQASMTVDALGTLRTRLRGAATAQILPQGVLRRRLIGAAGATVSPTGLLTLGGGTPAEPVTTVMSITDTANDGVTAANAATTFVNNDMRAGVTLGTTYYAGWRFPNVQIPRGAVVQSAVFAPKQPIQTPSGSIWGQWKTAAVDNLLAWTNALNPLNIAKNTAGATAVSAASSVSLVDACQAVFDRPGWAVGNAMALTIDASTANGAWLSGDGPGSAATLTITWLPPSLNALTLSTTSAYDDTLNNETVATIGGTTGGGLSVNDPSGLFTILGTDLIAQANLVAGTYPISITETLSGSPNSPRSTSFTIIVDQAPIFRFLGSGTGTTTATIPTHRAGDLLLAFAFRDGSNTLPTIPSGWTAINNPTGANTCSHVLVGRIATGSNTTTGTFTSATSLIVGVYRVKPGYSVTWGASATQTAGTATSVTYPALAPQSASFWAAAFAGHRSVNTALENPPTGMLLRASVVDATDEAAAFDTNGFVSSWSAQSVALGGTASGWRSVVVEIKIS